jgi:hypothetical protein
MICAEGCSPDPTAAFARAFEAGADCRRLFELRNTARHGASTAQQEEMNTTLRSVQCFSSTSKRAEAGPSNTGSFTVQEYRVYRDVLTTPSSIPEAEAIEIAGRRHGVTTALARKAVDHVMEVLSTNQWFASPGAEIQHASDWNGETK